MTVASYCHDADGECEVSPSQGLTVTVRQDMSALTGSSEPDPQIVWSVDELPAAGGDLAECPLETQIVYLISSELAGVRQDSATGVTEDAWNLWSDRHLDLDTIAALADYSIDHFCPLEEFQERRLFYFRPLSAFVVYDNLTGQISTWHLKSLSLQIMARALKQAWSSLLEKEFSRRAMVLDEESDKVRPVSPSDGFRTGYTNCDLFPSATGRVLSSELQSIVGQWTLDDRLCRGSTNVIVAGPEPTEYLYGLELWPLADDDLPLICVTISMKIGGAEEALLVVYPFVRTSCRLEELSKAYQQAKRFLRTLAAAHRFYYQRPSTPKVVDNGSPQPHSPTTQCPALKSPLPPRPRPTAEKTVKIESDRTLARSPAHALEETPLQTRRFCDLKEYIPQEDRRKRCLRSISSPIEMPGTVAKASSEGHVFDIIPSSDPTLQYANEITGRFKAQNPKSWRTYTCSNAEKEYVLRVMARGHQGRNEYIVEIFAISEPNEYRRCCQGLESCGAQVFFCEHSSPLSADKDASLQRLLLFGMKTVDAKSMRLVGLQKEEPQELKLQLGAAAALFRQSIADDKLGGHAYLEKLAFRCRVRPPSSGEADHIRLVYWRVLRHVLALNLSNGRLLMMPRTETTVAGICGSLAAGMRMATTNPRFFAPDEEYRAFVTSDEEDQISMREVVQRIQSYQLDENLSPYRHRIRQRNGEISELVYCAKATAPRAGSPFGVAIAVVEIALSRGGFSSSNPGGIFGTPRMKGGKNEPPPLRTCRCALSLPVDVEGGIDAVKVAAWFVPQMSSLHGLEQTPPKR